MKYSKTIFMLFTLLFLGMNPPAYSITPETGWWWSTKDKAAEDAVSKSGQEAKTSKSGYTIEQQGKTIFFATYLYDADGRPTWFSAVLNRKENSEVEYTGDLQEFQNGMTLTDGNKIGEFIQSPGKVKLLFTSPTDATLTLVNREIPITRFLFATDASTENMPQVRFELSRDDQSIGDLVVVLDQDKASATTENFLKYVNAKFYDGTILHRVVTDDPIKLIQGGGFLPGIIEKDFPEGLGRQIVNESNNGLNNRRGTIAMTYRQGQPHTATSQFFFNLINNPGLDRSNTQVGYAVFGKISEGLTVLDEIAKTKVQDENGHDHVPVNDIIVKRVCKLPC